MGRIIPPASWTPISLDGHCQNWTADYDGTETPMGNRAVAPTSIAHAINHMLARHPRPLFSYFSPIGQADNGGMDPLLRWMHLDNFDNGRSYTVHIIAVMPESVVTAWYAQQWSGADFYDAGNITAKSAVVTNSVDRYRDVVYLSFKVQRGAVTDATCEDGLSTFDGCTVLAVTVIEDVITELDTTIHTYCNPLLARQGKAIVADAVADVRAKLHERRSTGLPIVVNWSAQGDDGTPSVPGDQTGLHITSTSYVNLFDQSEVARTATSPGWCCSALWCGRGLRTATGNNKVKVVLRVLGEADSNNGMIYFEGSDNIASNSTEITITGAGGLGWYGSDSNFVYLDSSIAVDSLTTAMNKIDALGKVITSGNVYVYAIRGWVIYT